MIRFIHFPTDFHEDPPFLRCLASTSEEIAAVVAETIKVNGVERGLIKLMAY